MKLSYLKAAITGLVMITSAVVSSSNATLITDLSALDWLVAGDNKLTLDGTTGLEWLDVSETYGNSILNTEAESFFGEFRWATSLEIENLFDAVIVGTGYREESSSTVLSKATTFRSLFNGSNINITQGVSRGSPHPTDSNRYGLGYVLGTASNLRVQVADPSYNCCWLETSRSSNVGSWLVRASEIPEPGTLAIFALGMIGLASRRFKKQS